MALLSEEDVKTIVSRAIGTNVSIHSYNLEPFSKTREGIMGSHHQLTVEVKDNSNIKKYTYFLKTYLEKGCGNESGVGDAEVEKYSFAEEENFFSEVVPLMMKKYRGEKWAAKCYLVKPGALFFEDLRVQGYTMGVDFMLGEKTLRSTIVPLARFHACSILAEAELGKSLKEAFPKSFEEKNFSKKFKFWKSNEVCLSTIDLMAKRLDLDPNDLPKILDYICKIVVRKIGNVNVINHGDLWKNNLMFNNDNDCLIIDYQNLRYTSFGCDLGILIQLNMDPASVKDVEMELVKFYYTIFQDTLRQSDIDVQIPTYEKMLKEYKEHRILGHWLMCNYSPLMSLTYEEAMGIMGNSEGINRWLYGDRFGLFESHLDSNPDFAANVKTNIAGLLTEGKRVLQDNGLD